MSVVDGDLDAMLKRLNLANARRIWRDLVASAESEAWPYRRFLEVLVGEEVAHRQRTRLQRCTRKARFPFLRTIEDFDFQYQSQLRLALLGSFLGPDFVTEGRSLILYGRSGRGKTHLAVAIAYRAIQNGFEALFTTAAELIDELSLASRRGAFREALTRYTRVHVLVVDEVGYLAYGLDAANVLFHVVNDRHLSRRPMIVTTNKPLASWGEVLHDPDLGEAIVDRILERGRVLALDGPSLRTRHIDQELISGPAACTGPFRPPIPTIPATRSDGFRSTIPTPFRPLLGRRSEWWPEWFGPLLGAPRPLNRWSGADRPCRVTGRVGPSRSCLSSASKLGTAASRSAFAWPYVGRCRAGSSERRWVIRTRAAILSLLPCVPRGGRGWPRRGYPCAR